MYSIFLSYSSDDVFEASLLQFAMENLLSNFDVRVWTYERDQPKDQRSIAKGLKEQVKSSRATVFLASSSTLKSGAQWMELAYSDAFQVPTFILLHRIPFARLHTRGVAPYLTEGQCTSAKEWRTIIPDLQKLISPGQGRSRRA